ncbi:hypothetical protein RIVM261_045330 [Rivularia sp. IAM M-261]|nr:hypothetical protein RIVM261_045330 [Rivularia sp. IAM M-261]
MGGVYYLTPDEIFHDGNTYIIQESKNTSKGSLPQMSDIRDGLFKLILFSNLDSLTLDRKPVSFITKLKLTGNNVIGAIIFPDASNTELESFLTANSKIFNKNQKKIIKKLALEAKHNQKLKIEITSNTI